MDPSAADTDAAYEAAAREKLIDWRRAMLKRPGRLAAAAKGVQNRINRAIPEKAHAAITSTIEGMTRGLLSGASLRALKPVKGASLRAREILVSEKIKAWSATASAEGGIAGAGGFLLAVADFPALIAIKINLLYDVAAAYGHDTRDFGERLYLLHVFELAFSSAAHRARVLAAMEDWDARAAGRPRTPDDLDWRAFQEEYRDHIDLAKLAQLLPLVGAPVGAIVNYRLMNQLGVAAINAYRMRWFARSGATSLAKGPDRV